MGFEALALAEGVDFTLFYIFSAKNPSISHILCVTLHEIRINL